MSSRRSEKILLTGGAGFIGTKLRLGAGARFEFIVFDKKENYRDDVRDFARVRRAVSGVEGVIHLAAVSRPKWGMEDPYQCLTTNITGTYNVLEAIRRENLRAWLIFGSSREVFGNVQKFPATEESPKKPLNAYAVSKLSGEMLLRQYAANYGIRSLVLRFSSVYTGIEDIPDRVVPLFIRQALSGKPVTIEGDGKKAYDFVYIDDAVYALERAIRFMQKKPAGFFEDITLARGAPITLRELARKIIHLSGSRSRIRYLSDRTYDQEGFWGTNRKARRLLGWQPVVGIDEGLLRVIREFRSHGTSRER